MPFPPNREPPPIAWCLLCVIPPSGTGELAVESDAHSGAGIRFASLEREVERDRAHDAVAEILVDQRLERRPVHLEDLVEAVDRRIGRRKRVERAPCRDLLEDCRCVVGQLEEAAHSGGMLRTQWMLAV